MPVERSDFDAPSNSRSASVSPISRVTCAAGLVALATCKARWRNEYAGTGHRSLSGSSPGWASTPLRCTFPSSAIDTSEKIAKLSGVSLDRCVSRSKLVATGSANVYLMRVPPPREF